MDRKEFLKTLWYKYIKPLVVLGMLILCVRFIIRIFTQNDTEQLIAIIVLGLIILSGFSYMLGLVFSSLLNSMKSRLSERTENTIKIPGKVFGYLLSLALGIITYLLWQNDVNSLVAIFGAALILQLIETIKKEKKTQVTKSD